MQVQNDLRCLSNNSIVNAIIFALMHSQYTNCFSHTLQERGFVSQSAQQKKKKKSSQH